MYKYNLLGLDRLERSIDSTNKIGLGLFVGSFVVSRIDKREMKADKRAADLKMEILRNETKADTRQMTFDTRLYNLFTLSVAISAVVVSIMSKKST